MNENENNSNENDSNEKDGIQIGNYILKNKSIGEGSCGKVYEARDQNFKIYATKRFEIKNLMAQEMYFKFGKILKIHYKLNHKNIIRILDVKRTKEFLYLFMEFCTGENLLSFSNNYFNLFHKNLSLKLIQFFVKQIIDALIYMSKKKCMHRDIKLENIMLTLNTNFNEEEKEKIEKLKKKLNENDFIKNIKISESFVNNYSSQKNNFPSYYYYYNIDKNNYNNINEYENIIEKYTIKLIDFDYVKEFDNSSETMKSFYGSPLNLAPEIWEIQYGNNCKGYKENADIWSLGIVIYNLVYSKFPFNGNSFKSIYNKILKGNYYIYNKENVSVELIDLINGLLKVNAEKRFNWEQIFNHPFYNVSYNKQKKFDFKGKDFIELNANDYERKFIDNYELKNKIVIENDEEDNLKEKYINEIFNDNNCEEIEYSTKCVDADDGWVNVELNDKL